MLRFCNDTLKPASILILSPTSAIPFSPCRASRPAQLCLSYTLLLRRLSCFPKPIARFLRHSICHHLMENVDPMSFPPANSPLQPNRKVAKFALGSQLNSPECASPAPHSQMPALRVKKLSETAVLPSRGSAGAAGFDLASAHDAVVPARGKALVKTDISIAIPEGTYARVAPRSGLAWKHSIDVGAGVVDYDYRGNVGVILFNFSDTDFSVKAGDRIAQLILEQIMTPEVVEVDSLDDTERGAGGYGSTGVATVENGAAPSPRVLNEVDLL